MGTKKIIVALLIIVVAIGGFVAGLALLRQRQEIREEASVPTGQAEVSITPDTGQFEVGDTIRVSVFFNSANIPISGVAVKLTYPFTGATPEVTASNPTVNSVLLSSGQWTCPTQNSSLEGGNVVIEIGCGNQGALGYVSNTDTLFANFDLKIEREPAARPFVISFDSDDSLITRKSDNQDILLIPTSSGTYTIGAAQATATLTPTPTSRLTTTPSPTSRLTSTPTPTRVSSASATPTTASGGLPEAGTSFPTVFGLSLGMLLIVGALLLAL